MKAKLILSTLIVLTVLTTRFETCNAGTGAVRDTIPAFSLDILPEIERDLALCDLYKERIPLLTAQVAQRTAERDFERGGKLAAQSETKREKRKRVVSHIKRTIVEIAVLVILLKTL